MTIAPDGRHGEREPLSPFDEEEARRVVDSTILGACEHLPPTRPGIILVETERSWAAVHDLQRQTEEWFRGPIGSEYGHVAGVLLTHRPLWTDFPCVTLAAAWRPDAPRWLVRSRLLQDMANGLRWADVCAWAWRRTQVH